MTTTPQTTEQIVKQAYIINTHATVAAMGVKIGDSVKVINHYTDNENAPNCGRNGAVIPAGHVVPTGHSRRLANALYGSKVKFLGVNADGDVVVSLTADRHQALPYSFISFAGEEKNAKIRLNESFEGTIFRDSDGRPKPVVAVGCQRFQIAKLREFLALYDKVEADAKAGKVKEVVKITANPVATYAPPTPKPVKKAAAKKVPAKKVASPIKGPGPVRKSTGRATGPRRV